MVVCQSRHLGFAEFPWSQAPNRVVTISPGSRPGGADVYYNHGDTLTHELCHHIGLLHTFGITCKGSGDNIDDTNTESPAHWGTAYRSSCGSTDPVSNYMDYSADEIMCSFTEFQAAAMWDMTKKYAEDIWEISRNIKNQHYTSLMDGRTGLLCQDRKQKTGLGVACCKKKKNARERKPWCAQNKAKQYKHAEIRCSQKQGRTPCTWAVLKAMGNQSMTCVLHERVWTSDICVAAL